MVNTALIVPPDEWEEVKKSLAEIKSRLAENSAEEFSNEILTSEEARKILGICPRTWQLYRDKHLIDFSQIGRKVYVKRSDLNEFMANYSIKRTNS